MLDLPVLQYTNLKPIEQDSKELHLMLVFDSTVHRTICILLYFNLLVKYCFIGQSKSEFYSASAE